MYRTGALSYALLWPWAVARPGASVGDIGKTAKQRGTSHRPCIPHWGFVRDAVLGPWAVTRLDASVQDNYKTTTRQLQDNLQDNYKTTQNTLIKLTFKLEQLFS